MLKFLCVCGARPNFMKIAPIVDALDRHDGAHTRLVHTGQHYDQRMSRLFFEDLRLRRPDANLEVGSGSHAAQTATIMQRFEPVCSAYRPHWLVVVGDVNSTLACALVAAKMGIPIAHVEAGLRSFDRGMPEEINRLLTDAISERLFATEPTAVDNLRREGISGDRIHLVGNVMIDTLLRCRAQADQSMILSELELQPQRYVIVTLHRPSNVDHRGTFSGILDALEAITAEMPVVFPVHPRTRAALSALDLARRADRIAGLRLLPPLGYLDFTKLMSEAAVVLTDSGGIQEETTILNVPCLTLRPNTERPITLTHGTNRLTGNAPEAILTAFHDVCEHPPRVDTPPTMWDGRAAARIVAALVDGALDRTDAHLK